ncbi:hypothetical protein DLH72_04325 [Candidatus Gracilibacteria bacterium]|nr:MAG: hypothetical protein DLH72_04325 [Candidatus Gracilibacteria bacterium]
MRITYFKVNNFLTYKKMILNFSETNINFLASEIQKLKKENETLIIGISGGSASGKTSLVTPKLKEILEKDFEVSILNMDNFQMGKEFVENLKSLYKYDDKRNFCLEEVNEILWKLKNGENVEIPKFSLEKVVRDGKIFFKNAEIILLEGIYATDEILQKNLDFSIFVEDEVTNMLTKRILRYALEMKLKNGPVGALKQYLKYVLPAYNDLVLEQKQKANVIIKIDFDFHFLIEKYDLESKEINIENEKILFSMKNENLELIGTDKKFFINFKGKNYFSFEIND